MVKILKGLRGFYPFFLLMGLSVKNVNAQTENKTLEYQSDKNSLLWEISGNGLARPSYFLGTMHVLCPEDAYLSDAVMTVIEKVNEVYFEIDLDNMGLMMTALRHMSMRNDTLLSDLLPEEDLKELETYFSGKMPLPFGVLKRVKPMLLAGMLSEQMLPCKAGSGTEMLISEVAAERKIPTKGLETPEYQFGLFDSIPYAYQAQELLKAVREGDKEPKDDGVTTKMLTAFQAQDLEELAKLTAGESSGISEYLDLLVYNRNKNWVEQFSKIAPEGSFLFAVGAGHLPGDNGVLKLLEKKGFSVRPLINKKPS